MDHSPLKIGNRELPSRYFLAPLAGYTQRAFRLAVRELGGLGLATTDLVLAHTLLHGSQKSLRLVRTAADDKPLSIQLYGGDAYTIGEAAKWLVDRGYEGIDINMGCPMAKLSRPKPAMQVAYASPLPNELTAIGGGARLMCDQQSAADLVRTVVEAVDVPVTVKMRLGWDRENVTAPLLARTFEQEGVAAITIHGRTRQQGFNGGVDLEGIAATAAAVDSIPVIGNGDVRTVEDALDMRRRTGCAAVAIGRGALMDPWIFRKLNDAATGMPLREPTPQELIDFLVRHFALMHIDEGDDVCRLFRKFAAWYGAKLGIPDDLEDRLRRFESRPEFEEIVSKIRERHGERLRPIPTALIKVPNGPIDKW
ncbi:MAG: tRNA-dihydrouridine synthase [Planctomycetota bacterium]|nr:tRNA-dihydrouridine synthase [Planctomycetaceae bacterium]MDQ3330356.1 tRNA-dihydrouridine synthase [Planctomycetota bacterium]